MSAKVLTDDDYILPRDGGIWIEVGGTASIRIKLNGDLVSIRAYRNGCEADEPYDSYEIGIPDSGHPVNDLYSENDIKEVIASLEALVAEADLGEVELDEEGKAKLERAREALRRVKGGT
mgnify:FL=1